MHRVRFQDPAGSIRNGTWHGEYVSFGNTTYETDMVSILPPSNPTKIVCVGLNYADHAEERNKNIPDRPLLFLKPPNVTAGHGDIVTLPSNKERIDHEAELAVVIDTQARHISAADAMEYVAGFTCLNDLSNRDDQDREQNWVRGKAFDNAAPMGPVLATPDEVPADATVELRVNGETRQSSTRSELIFSVPELIEEITTYMTLEPGDIISTGTTSGVAALSDGDHIDIWIEGIGTLTHDVRIP
ncbi:fumarylacetoacetate hydrolase family protein [Haloquadratum walsbyi]|jgi:2-keto-4-pentenoate hydratase/2-oxohepta-3-ene-1,7-dioic acid hydratase (catechol pathway)|uniref:2-keto-4-pentenoate hydratase/2-oxohepta-3-ene-1,7-dioic acid hydratase (Catechol pathway) n=1 Tax=Haloquadratum walsbyi J07HQW2 TaxID=1238425 RepID=U1NEV9_9EURY|nr:fumarylacetoacetate hydrolase family protein [Haloquadratum walsbyi]ERG95580.1 MAG: 2-keto-4-pentenoate hydratase/2-oxohepta-3-ene-1,7-dioic acid hydratase (catechol pathway) [Haloquadratum walsbyi J07HQW2]